MIGLVCACIQVLAQFSLNRQFLVDCTNRRLQDDVSALIETEQVERVLADLDADGGDREWR
jgi:hypothetical protein